MPYTMSLTNSIYFNTFYSNNKGLFTINCSFSCPNKFFFGFFASRKSQNESSEEEQELPAIFMKTLAYTQRFSKFVNRETIGAMRRWEGI